MLKSDAYRYKKEIIDKISLSKQQRDPYPTFNWALGLRNSSVQNINLNLKEQNHLTNSFTVTPKLKSYGSEIRSQLSLYKSSMRESCIANRNFDK